MTAASRLRRSVPRRPLAVLLVAVAFAAVSQSLAPKGLPATSRPDPLDLDAPLTIDAAVPVAAIDDLERIRANVAFWSDRVRRSPRDFIGATRWAESEIELARATGDVEAYVVADEAITAALAADADFAPALGDRGVVLVALHRFREAVDHATAVLASRPDDPVALGTLGDGSLELGDLATARTAYQRLAAIDPSAAALVRQSHLAFIVGDPAAAVDAARRAVTAATDEGAIGPALAWYHFQLGEVSTATGDAAAGREAYGAALAADPSSWLARSGLARLAAADGDLDAAIGYLDTAIARVPLPEFHARRADLAQLRGAPGDAARAADDRATVLAIAQLGGVAASVRDRQLSLYLASHGLQPERALRLAEAEIALRKDTYGYDALAWALLANGRSTEAQQAMDRALASGTQDARLRYHAGMIAIARGDVAGGRERLQAALDLDPTFDAWDVARIRAILSSAP